MGPREGWALEEGPYLDVIDKARRGTWRFAVLIRRCV